MKIAIITPILYDEKSPFNHLFKDILEGWLNAGHEVVRIVSCENITDENYKMGIESDNISYIPVRRKKAKKSNIIVRYLRDTWTNIRMAKKLKKIQDADILFEDVSYSSYWSVKAAKKRKLRVISMLQDVWPDNAVASGLISKGGLIYRFFEAWQKKVYKKSDKLICISDDMKAFIASKGVLQEKISVIYNWGYTDETVDIPWDKNEFVKKYQLDKNLFYAVYAGNIGRMQNIELIVLAAEKLQAEKDIRFLIIGDGVHRENIENLVKEKELKNVDFLPMQPSKLATSIYSAASVNIIPLVAGGVNTALPSKTGVVLSCGRPTVFCFGEDCAFGTVASQYEGVSNVGLQTEDGLIQKILELYKGDIIKSDGAKQLFKAKFTRSGNIQKYIICLEKE